MAFRTLFNHSNSYLRLIWLGLLVVSTLHMVVFQTTDVTTSGVTSIESSANTHGNSMHLRGTLGHGQVINTGDNNTRDESGYKRRKRLAYDSDGGSNGSDNEIVSENVFINNDNGGRGFQKFSIYLKNNVAVHNPAEYREPHEDIIKRLNASGELNNIRPKSCRDCFRTAFTFSTGANICRTQYNGQSEPVDAIIMITSSYTHMRQRKTLCSTWLTRTNRNTAKVRYAFIFGETKNSQMRKYVDNESKVFHDIVIANFTDSYRNLTYKTLAAFHWVLEYCSQPKFVIKSDDDMFINMDNMIRMTLQYKGLLYGYVMGSCKRLSPVRDELSRYYVPYSVYPYEYYPSVCSGTAYITGIRVIKDIVRVSSNTPFFSLEDVYIGFCLKRLGYGTKRHPGFLEALPGDGSLCMFKGKLVIAGHIRSWRTIQDIWEKDCTIK